MKKILIALLPILSSFSVSAQDITGQWNGLLKTQGIQLRVVFNIVKDKDGYSSTMDSPDQGAKDIPVSSTTFENSQLKLEVEGAGIEYEGQLGKDNIIVGNFKQGGLSIPFNLSREVVQKEKTVRPQDPVKPYPYYEEEVTFENKPAGISLGGTLTLPKKEGVYPAVILITGSGPENRNEEIFGHKPFLVLSDNLTRNGIAVLRYDDRGIDSSKGDFKTATTADFATDVEAAVKYLRSRKEINRNKIGLMGHSEGGVIAPMVAARGKDIAFIVLLAGTGIPGDSLLLLQNELIGRVGGMSEDDLLKSRKVNREVYAIVKGSEATDQAKSGLTKYFKQHTSDLSDADIEKQVNQIASPWMQYFLKYDPATALKKVKCPVLAINGSKDLQVPPKENLEAIRSALAIAKNKNVAIKELPGLNHLFQECKTCVLAEYATIEQTFSPVALKVISEWIGTIVN